MSVWVKKYAPKNFSEMVMDVAVSNLIRKDMSGGIQNMLFSGSYGIGKTTTARLLAKKYGYEVLFINASKERNIDTLRNDVERFVSTTSMLGGSKMVILDEADNLNKTSTQPALRAFIEQYYDVCFIMTANNRNGVIAPLRSRVTEVEFSIAPSVENMKNIMQRLITILGNEGITQYDTKMVVKMVKRKFPDIRGMINTLQLNSDVNEHKLNLDDKRHNTTELEVFTESFFSGQLTLNGMRKFVVDNDAMPYQEIFNSIMHYAEKIYTDDFETLEKVYTQFNHFDFRAAFVSDQVINTLSFLISIDKLVNKV